VPKDKRGAVAAVSGDYFERSVPAFFSAWQGAFNAGPRNKRGLAHGERLIGCIECNRWGMLGSANLFMALPEDDLQASISLTRAIRPKTLRPNSGSSEAVVRN